jgi:hypothetical protein
MNILWYVQVYHHGDNQRARFLVTAPNPDVAQYNTLEGMVKDGWVCEHTFRICQTTDKVDTEL